MKKILGILAAIGLTATASSAVVSCGVGSGTNKENNGGDIEHKMPTKLTTTDNQTFTGTCKNMDPINLGDLKDNVQITPGNYTCISFTIVGDTVTLKVNEAITLPKGSTIDFQVTIFPSWYDMTATIV